jgi:hypothetical protein
MKKLLVLSMVFVSFVSYGQNRVDAPRLSWYEKSLSINGSDFWSYSDYEKKWSKTNSLNNVEFLKNVNDGSQFNSMYVNSIFHKGKKYYVLVQRIMTYYYYYPSIYRDRYDFTTWKLSVFNETDFEKIKNIQVGEEVNINSLYHYYAGNTAGYGHKTFDEGIKNSLNGVLREYFDADFQNVYESDKGYVFRVKKTTNNGNIVYRFLTPYKNRGYSDIDFEKCYFERTSIKELFTFTK